MSAPGGIDVHAHAFSGGYVALLARLGAVSEVMHTTQGVFSDSQRDDVEQRLAVMDLGNVERQVLSMSAATPYFENVSSAKEAARFINDEHAEMCRAFPDRFSFFCVLPMPHIDASLAEAERAFTELGAAGVTFTTHVLGRALSDPSFAAIFAELDRRSAVAFIHPVGTACGSPIIAESNLSWTIGAPIEDAVCALQLMQADFPRRYPRLKVILPHLGGFLAFLRYRLGRSTHRWMPGAEDPATQMRKFWYDTSNGEPAALRASIECYGIDKLLLGTDYPYWMPGTGYEHSVDYFEHIDLSKTDVAAIRRENACRLFGL
jgi:predicted TIM-barrel fold metal-dependent hydrolase